MSIYGEDREYMEDILYSFLNMYSYFKMLAFHHKLTLSSLSFKYFVVLIVQDYDFWWFLEINSFLSHLFLLLWQYEVNALVKNTEQYNYNPVASWKRGAGVPASTIV